MNKTFNTANPNYNACVGNNGYNDLSTYSEGYDESVKFLLETVFESKSTLDTIVYPIVYAARHRIELFLKHQLLILSKINSVYNPIFTYKLMATHEISKLWDQFKTLAKVEPRYNALTCKLDEYITDFYKIDDTGEVFRYPNSNNGLKHLTDIHCINLEAFAQRYFELSEILEELGYLSDFISDEYIYKSVVKNLSRATIYNIATTLPKIDTWKNDSFKESKQKIMKTFSISSNTLQKVINFIKSHREFSLIIGKEIPIQEIRPQQFILFIKKYDEFRKAIAAGNYFDKLEIYIDKMSKKFTLKEIASLSQLYDIGYFKLYSEEYDIGLQRKLKETKRYLLQFCLLGNGIVKEMIIKGANIIGQKTLCEIYANMYK